MRRIMLRKKRIGEDSGDLRHRQAVRDLLVHPQLGAMRSEGSAATPQNFCTLLPTYYCILDLLSRLSALA